MKSQGFHDARGWKYKHLKDTAPLDRSDGSLRRFDAVPLVTGSTSEIASTVD